MATVLTKKHRVSFTVDDYDVESVLAKTWCITYYGYPATTVNDKLITLHQFLLGKAPIGLEWDHIDRNKLNNSRSNLRLLNRSGNNRNKDLQSNNTSGIKGVSFRQDIHKWRARIKVNGKEISLGNYDTINDAIAARKDGEQRFWNDSKT